MRLVPGLRRLGCTLASRRSAGRERRCAVPLCRRFPLCGLRPFRGGKAAHADGALTYPREPGTLSPVEDGPFPALRGGTSAAGFQLRAVKRTFHI